MVCFGFEVAMLSNAVSSEGEILMGRRERTRSKLLRILKEAWSVRIAGDVSSFQMVLHARKTGIASARFW
jgi:hypothetical protein